MNNCCAEVLEKYLEKVISNSTKCLTCKFNHGGWCFWGMDCIANDFEYYKTDRVKVKEGEQTE